MLQSTGPLASTGQPIPSMPLSKQNFLGSTSSAEFGLMFQSPNCTHIDPLPWFFTERRTAIQVKHILWRP